MGKNEQQYNAKGKTVIAVQGFLTSSPPHLLALCFGNGRGGVVGLVHYKEITE
jgi:hypothetical protein